MVPSCKYGITEESNQFPQQLDRNAAKPISKVCVLMIHNECRVEETNQAEHKSFQ